MREYHYRVDAEGRVFHDGSEVLDPLTLRFFVRAMQRTPDGRWLVVCQGERNWFEADETPLVVQRVHPLDRAAGPTGLELRLAGDHREPLEPATLEVVGGRLGCRVRRAALPARFGRVALQQLAPYLVEEDGALALVVGGTRHPVPERDRGWRPADPADLATARARTAWPNAPAP
ncbi:MAG TPA: hypothetical protein VFC42_08970 [Methylomirabilota bacterium]|jgi:hypothetical protein|nr:hypothetical protein [Methylomirabilota bacterium]